MIITRAGPSLHPGSTDGETFLDGKVDEALQDAFNMQFQPTLFAHTRHKLQEIADETFLFVLPMVPQPKALNVFVQKSMAAFPETLSTCREDVELVHHLQRYAACYIAHKSGYFQRHDRPKRPKLTIKLNMGLLKTQPRKKGARTEAPAQCKAPFSNNGGAGTIKAFLASCQPPMSHLFRRFQRANITGEKLNDLRSKAGMEEDAVRAYLLENSIATSMLEVEALVHAFQQKGS